MKKYGGHKKYMKFVSKRDNVLFETLKWTRLMALAGWATVAALIIIEILKGCNHPICFNNTNTHIPVNKPKLEINK